MTDTINVTLGVAFNSSGEPFKSYSVQVASPATVADVLAQAKTADGLTYETADSGAYVTSINGVEQNSADRLAWIFGVDGNESNTGIQTAAVQDGDIVQFSYQRYPNGIYVSECDNELVFVAFNGSQAYTITQILSGNSHKVSVELQFSTGQFTGTQSVNGVNQDLNETLHIALPKGTWNIVATGLNWGGPAAFTASVNSTPMTNQLTDSSSTGIVFASGTYAVNVGEFEGEQGSNTELRLAG